MPITPLPVFEADADPKNRSALTDQELYEKIEAPKSIVVRFGYLGQIAEFPYHGSRTPGCGTKLVSRTPRGTELVEMLTTTCQNSGCSKSISRQEMRDYIEVSGGKDFPFHTRGKIIRIATIEDVNKQSEINTNKTEYITACKALIREFMLDMKLVEVEPILGGELVTFYYMSEDRVDFRELVRELAAKFKTRIEMRQVGARDEARLVADYERCGQHCCCKGFLKVLKPVSMKSAKVQKATLDPLKISGRCGRLMCCLRYEDQTYKELKANLPRKKSRVGTNEGPGIVMDTRIITQLALVKLEHDNREIAVPIEELMDPETCPKPGEMARMQEDPLRGMDEGKLADRMGEPKEDKPGRKRRRRRRGRGGRPESEAGRTDTPTREPGDKPAGEKPQPKADAASGEGDAKKKRRRRRRRRRGGGQGPSGDGGGSGEG